MRPGEVIVRVGTYLYDGNVRGDVRIVQTPLRSTLGDPAAATEDAQGTWFDVEYTPAGERDQFKNGVVGFDSLESAVRWVAATFSGVVWRE